MTLHLHYIPDSPDPYEAWWKAANRLRYDVRQAMTEGDQPRFESLRAKLQEALTALTSPD